MTENTEKNIKEKKNQHINFKYCKTTNKNKKNPQTTM